MAKNNSDLMISCIIQMPINLQDQLDEITANTRLLEPTERLLSLHQHHLRFNASAEIGRDCG